MSVWHVQIFTSVYGTAFCYSSFQALKLLVHNLGRATLVEGVSHWVEIFGRAAIASLSTGLAVLMMTYLPYYQDNVSSFLFPALIIFVISWMIASFFMMVLSVAVDTIFMCFLIDETVHDSPRFASHNLTQMVAVAQDSYQKMLSDDEQQLDDDTHREP